MKKYFLLSTSLFVLLSTLLGATVIPIEPGNRTIYYAVRDAQDGDTLELANGTYNETSTITIDKQLTIRNAENAKPIIFANRISIKASCTLDGVVIDGNSEKVDAIRIEEGLNLKFKLLNSRIQNYTSRAIYFYATDKTTAFADTIIVNGCIFKNMERAVYAGNAPEQFQYLEIKNSTFIQLDKNKYFIQLRPIGDDIVTGIKVKVDHCTFYNCIDRRGVYIFNLDGAEITNNIAYYSEAVSDTKSFSVYGPNSFVNNNISFNVDMYGNAPRQNVIIKNPLFVDAENENFQLYKDSPAVGAGNDGSNLGDPRWGVSTEDAPLEDLPYIPYKYPYSMSPTKNSVRILWQMSDTNPTGVVYYGKTEALGDSIVSDDGWMVTDEGFVHVKEITGLEPFTTYYYQVGNGVKRFEEIYTTQTAPDTGTAFRIAITSDFHDNSAKVWENMVTPLMQQNPNLFIHLGDIVNYGDLRPWNASFFQPSRPLLSKIPLIGAIGNHETGGKIDKEAPTTYYDYFSSPSHGYIDGSSFIDPRGESYYSMNYGDVKIISLNLNGDASSPSFNTNSQQMQWFDSQIENSDSKWIFVITHVSIYSTGYHGQWSRDQKAYVAPILEKHAANGKHIIVFSGNCHSWEHLYQAGVHHIRPGVAASNVREQYNMADLPYSLLWRQLNSFSTLDISEDGETVTLISRDKDGIEFYSYEFTRSAQMQPSLYFTEPDGINDTVTDLFRIKWTCFDPSGAGKINLYYSQDSINGTLLAENLSTDVNEIDHYDWHVRYLEPKGDYFIYGVINDGINPPFTKYARGKVTVAADTIAPPAPTNFSITPSSGKFILSWETPTREIDVEKIIDTFEEGINGYIGVPEDAEGLIETTEGKDEGTGMKISYDINKAWGEFAVSKIFDEVQDYSLTPYLEFWYKGDGSTRELRIIVKQDLDYNGKADDWWYAKLNLSSTEWKKAKLDMRTFEAFTWHPNASKEFDISNVFAIDIAVSSGLVGDGYVCIDDIILTGRIYPAPDFEGTKILRRTDRYPANHLDGEVVYNGNDETYTDEDLTANSTYYYAAFSYDDLNNYSEYNASASAIHFYSNLTSVNSEDALKIYPNPATTYVTILYSIPLSSMSNKLYIEDMTGRLISSMPINQQEGTYQHTLNLNEISSGVYFIKLKTDNDLLVKKVIVK